jgi:hypothetical protein
MRQKKLQRRINLDRTSAGENSRQLFYVSIFWKKNCFEMKFYLFAFQEEIASSIFEPELWYGCGVVAELQT